MKSSTKSYRDAQHIHDLFQFGISTKLRNLFTCFNFNIGQKLAAIVKGTSSFKELQGILLDFQRITTFLENIQELSVIGISADRVDDWE